MLLVRDCKQLNYGVQGLSMPQRWWTVSRAGLLSKGVSLGGAELGTLSTRSSGLDSSCWESIEAPLTKGLQAEVYQKKLGDQTPPDTFPHPWRISLLPPHPCGLRPWTTGLEPDLMGWGVWARADIRGFQQDQAVNATSAALQRPPTSAWQKASITSQTGVQRGFSVTPR